MQVRTVLKAKSRALFSIGPDANVSEAITILAEHNIGSLPVVDGQGRLVGIFTERDVLRGVAKDCVQFSRARIEDVMTHDPVTCDMDDTLPHVMGKMTEHRVGQLPVMGEERLVGVVSIGDVVKVLYEKVESENRHLLDYIYGPG